MKTRTSSKVALGALAMGLLAAPAMAQGKPAGPADKADAKEAECPPGAYCEKAAVEPPAELTEPQGGVAAEGAEATAAQGGTTVVIPPPPPGADPNAPRVLVVQPSPDGQPGQVVLYEPGAAPPHVPGASTPVRPVPPPPPPPPKRKWRRHRAWGMNLHLEGVLLPRYHSRVDAPGMVGLGLGLRYRPIPHFGIGLDADFRGGLDSMNYERREIPIALNAMVYPNPRDLVQFYAFGGVHVAYAQVFSDRLEPHLEEGTSDEYSYFGGQLGLGLEFRVSQLVGINIDGYGFLRMRLDDDGDGLYPEMYDPRSRESSNTSGGGVLRGGLTFWW